METYEQLTLGGLIGDLDELGDALVRGLGNDIDSYRGFYECNAIEPDKNNVVPAKDLAAAYRRQVGKEIEGYKGGTYYVNTRENVYCAGYGDTGPAICGFIRAEDGVYEPLLVLVDLFG